VGYVIVSVGIMGEGGKRSRRGRGGMVLVLPNGRRRSGKSGRRRSCFSSFRQLDAKKPDAAGLRDARLSRALDGRALLFDGP